MFNIKKILLRVYSLWCLSFIMTIVACGGGSDDDSNNDDGDDTEIKIGIFVDSPVINIGYRTATREGMTNSLGEFEYIDGESVTFFIGDLVFPETLAGEVVTPLEIAGTTSVTDNEVINILRLLQSIDSDDNPDNGIDISSDLVTVAIQVDFSLSTDDFANSNAVADLLSGVGDNELVSIENAVAHFQDELTELPLVEDEAIAIPVKAITIDGNDDDWAGVRPISLDDSDDQDGNSATDIIKVAIADSGDDIAILYQTEGDITLPHTSSQAFSHYEVGFHFFSNSDCDGDDNGFFIVNNFTSFEGENFHRIEYYFDETIEHVITNTAFSGNTLETSFSKQALPQDKGNYVEINPYSQSFDSGNQSTEHDSAQTSVCIQILGNDNSLSTNGSEFTYR